MDLTDRQLKLGSLLMLTCHHALLGLSMRYGRTRQGVDLFVNSTVVVATEMAKLATCLMLVLREEHWSIQRWKRKLYNTILRNKMDTVKVWCNVSVWFKR